MLKRVICILLVCSLSGCLTTKDQGYFPDLSVATPEYVTQVSIQMGEYFAAEKDSRVANCIFTCGLTAATVYLSESLGHASKSERVLAAVNEANRVGRSNFKDVLGDQTFTEFIAERYSFGEMSPSDIWIGIIKWFVENFVLPQTE